MENSIFYVSEVDSQNTLGTNAFVIHKDKESVFLVTSYSQRTATSGNLCFNGKNISYNTEAYDAKEGFTILRLQNETMVPLKFSLNLKDGLEVKLYLCIRNINNYKIKEIEGILFNSKNNFDIHIKIFNEIPGELFGIHPILEKKSNEVVGFTKNNANSGLSVLPIDSLKKIWLKFPDNSSPSSGKIGDVMDTEDPNSKIYSLSLPKIWLPKGLIAEKLPDILTPGISNKEFIDSYLKVLDQKQVTELVQQFKKSISAVENGDFLEYTKVANNINSINSGIPEVDSTAQYFLGEGYRLLGDESLTEFESKYYYNMAEETFHNSILQDPNSPKGYRALGAIYEKKYIYDKAFENYKKSLELTTSNLLLPIKTTKNLATYHEILRNTRHIINIIIKIKDSNSLSMWHKPDKINELSKYIEECERLHRLYMPLFKRQKIWFYFEWFAGWLFIAKAWADVGNTQFKIRSLIFALISRRQMLDSKRELTKIEVSNLKWWVNTFHYKASKEEIYLVEKVNSLENSLNDNSSESILKNIEEIVNPFELPYNVTKKI